MISQEPLVQKRGGTPYDQIISIFSPSRGHRTRKQWVGEIPAAPTRLSGQVKSYKYKLHQRLVSDGAFVCPIPMILEGPCNRKTKPDQNQPVRCNNTN